MLQKGDGPTQIHIYYVYKAEKRPSVTSIAQLSLHGSMSDKHNAIPTFSGIL